MLVLILLAKETKDCGNRKKPWVTVEREGLNRKYLALPQSLSLAEQPDINIDRTENFNSIYNIESNSGLRLD